MIADGTFYSSPHKALNVPNGMPPFRGAPPGLLLPHAGSIRGPPPRGPPQVILSPHGPPPRLPYGMNNPSRGFQPTGPPPRGPPPFLGGVVMHNNPHPGGYRGAPPAPPSGAGPWRSSPRRSGNFQGK